MRSEHEIITSILDVAVADKRIRAVLLNGSRANPNIKEDILQDYDIVYIVDEIATFKNNPAWIDIFGERLILQMPDEMEIGYEKNKSGSFHYLMLFKDMNRIDLTIFPKSQLKTQFKQDSLTVVLLDKDNLFLHFPPSNDKIYHVEKPTEKMFTDCCNEFWLVSTNVAKGLWRNEIAYAMDMLEIPARKMFFKIVEWYIGIDTGFSVSFGKSAKNMQNLLPAPLYEKILLTYPDAITKNIWKSLFMMTTIFSDLANKISRYLSFTYNSEEQDNALSYLQRVYSLKKEN